MFLISTVDAYLQEYLSSDVRLILSFKLRERTVFTVGRSVSRNKKPWFDFDVSHAPTPKYSLTKKPKFGM